MNRKIEGSMEAGAAFLNRILELPVLVIGEETHPAIVLCLTPDTCGGVRGDLLIVDSDAEDEREGSLPAVAAG